MSGFTPDALVAYGFDDRVLALYNALLDDDDVVRPDSYPARVTRVERSACVVVGPDGSEHPLRGEPLPAVGDWVLATDGAVTRILPRWSALTRVDPSGAWIQVLAADVDLVVITTPADRSSPSRVEREIAVAWDSGAVPLVIVTKSDLDAGGVADGLRARLVGVDVIATSATTGDGVAELRVRLSPNRTAVLLGPSGAGKSTLANALLDAERLATAAVRDDDHRGRHTTTTRQLVTVPGGGVLIDTPGLRSVSLGGDIEIGAGFPDVESLAAQCRFADCRHEGEPDCAVNAAAADGRLDPDRLENYRKLLREVAAEQRRHDPLAARDARRMWRARSKDARAHDKRHGE